MPSLRRCPLMTHGCSRCSRTSCPPPASCAARCTRRPSSATARPWTSARVAEAIGAPAEPIVGTGLLVRLGQGAAPVVVRSELDGLPIEERTGIAYASQNGCMHACGHDVHMAALVALTRAVARLGDARPAPFWAVFQPSEEAHPLGAEMIMQSGVLAGARAILAAHVHPGIPWGSVGADPGAVNAAADSLVFRITGSPGHARLPAPRARSGAGARPGDRRAARTDRPPARPAASRRRQRRRRAGRRGRERDPAVRGGARHPADARRGRSGGAARGRAHADRGRLRRARLPGRDRDRAGRAAARERPRRHRRRARDCCLEPASRSRRRGARVARTTSASSARSRRC